MNKSSNGNNCFFLLFLLLLLTVFVGCPFGTEKQANKQDRTAKEEADAMAVAKSFVKEKTDAAEIEELAKKITGKVPEENNSDETPSDSAPSENGDSQDDNPAVSSEKSTSSNDNSASDNSEMSSSESTSENSDKKDDLKKSGSDSEKSSSDSEKSGSDSEKSSSDSEKSGSDIKSSDANKSKDISEDSRVSKDSATSESSKSSDSSGQSTPSDSMSNSSGTSDSANPSSDSEEKADKKSNQSKADSQDNAEEKNSSDENSSSNSDRATVDSLNLEQQEAAKKSFTDLQKLHFGINQLIEKDKFDLTDLSEGFQKLKDLCKTAPCNVNIKFTPYILRQSCEMTIKSNVPFQWTFIIKDKKGEKRNCMILDATDDVPFLKITDEGKWKLAETALFLFGKYQFSLDSGSKNLLEGENFTILDTEKATSSVYFPAGEVPQFLELLFKMDLVTDGGTKTANGVDFYMEPKGKNRITLPVYTYYQEEKEKREKERGSSFGTTTTGPSPTTESIGNVIYGLFVDRFFESFGITDKNDVGFEIYLEDADKNRLTLYQGNP